MGIPAVAAKKDQLTIAVGSEFENLNPIVASQAVTNYMLYFAHRPLVVLDSELRWKPLLIKELPTIENKMVQRNGKSLSVTIQFVDGLKWGDGTQVTCKDLEFAWQVGKNKNVGVQSREPYENITGITAEKDSQTKCTVKMAVGKFNFLNDLPSPMPSHLESKVFNEFKNKPQGYDNNSLYTKNPTLPGLYNGPYVVSEVKLGSHVIFTPNPHFYGKNPSIQKVIVKLIANTGTMESNLRAGNVDLIPPAAGLGNDQAVEFEKRVKSENLPFEVLFTEGLIYAHIDLNLTNPILSDLRVRKALSMAFDKKVITENLLEGKAKVAIHFVTQKDPWYSDQTAIYKYNKKAAAKLLDEAGWKLGPKGIREKDGKPLKLTIMAVAGNKFIENVQAYLQESLKSLGIELGIKNEPGRVFFSETTNHRKFDMALYSWVSIPEQTPRSILHSESIPTEKNAWAGQNFTSFKSAEVDQAINDLEGEFDAKKRAGIAKKIIDVYTREIPVIPLYFRDANGVIPKGLKNYRMSGHLFYESLYAENWEF